MAGTQIGSMTNFPQGFANGLSVRGMPLLQMQPGQVFFVGNGPILNPNQRAASNNNRGTYLDPFSTLDYALSVCTQGRGDIVFVLPGHYETIPDASTLSFDCAGVAVIGLGSGNMRPNFVFTTATTANIQVRSANMSIQNCVFTANFADVASAFTGIRAFATSNISGTTFTVTGATTGTFYPGQQLTTGAPNTIAPGTIILSQTSGTTGGIGVYQINISQTVASTSIIGAPNEFCIDRCEFRDNDTVLNFVTLVTGAATNNCMDGITFTNNRIASLSSTAATTAIKIVGNCDRLTVNGNFGVWPALNDTACMIAAAATNLTNFQFSDNVLYKPNTSSTGGSFISGTGTGWTGQATNNLMYQLDATAGIWIGTGTGLGFNENYSPITGAADKSGLINPAAV